MDLEAKLEKLEALAFLVASVDGISEEEGFELEMLPGKVRGLYSFREAVEAYEQSGDIEKAMKHVDEPLVLRHTLKFGMMEPHILEVIDEVKAIMVEGSETAIDDYATLIQIKASEFDDEFDQKLMLGCIEETIGADGTSDIEMHFFLKLCRFWGISRFQVNGWWRDNLEPIIKKANELYPYDFSEDDEEF